MPVVLLLSFLLYISFYYPLKLLKMVQEKIIDWTDPEVRKEFEEEIKRWLVFSSNYSFNARSCISFFGLIAPNFIMYFIIWINGF